MWRNSDHPEQDRFNSKAYPIVSVVLYGGVIAQGQTVEPRDPRGFIKTDMHGLIAIDIGGRIVVGRVVESVRRRDA